MKPNVSKPYFVAAKFFELIGFVGFLICYFLYGISLMNIVDWYIGLGNLSESVYRATIDVFSFDFFMIGILWPCFIVFLIFVLIFALVLYIIYLTFVGIGMLVEPFPIVTVIAKYIGYGVLTVIGTIVVVFFGKVWVDFNKEKLK